MFSVLFVFALFVLQGCSQDAVGGKIAKAGVQDNNAQRVELGGDIGEEIEGEGTGLGCSCSGAGSCRVSARVVRDEDGNVVELVSRCVAGYSGCSGGCRSQVYTFDI